MKRRIGLLLAAATVLTAVGMFVPSPASAHTDACVGAAGRATLSAGLGLPPSSVTANFNITFNTGACAAKATLSASGTVTGACGQSRGFGTTTNGHNFLWTSAGTLLVLTGEVSGVVTAASDPTVANNSCANGTAKEFVVSGAGVLKHSAVGCPVTSGGTTTVGPATVNHALWICI
jgi:hypothetical protein